MFMQQRLRQQGLQQILHRTGPKTAETSPNHEEIPENT